MQTFISNDLIEVAEKFPDLTVSISIKDLIAANRHLFQETREELERDLSRSRKEVFLTKDKVMEMLDVSSSTLWRWQKAGYLVPVSVGGSNRFRLSDINRIIGQEEK